MTQPNHKGASTKRNNKFRWAVWFPYPTSWLKAFILMLILSLIIYISDVQHRIGDSLAYITINTEVLMISGLISILSPIPIISFIHHFIHLCIGNLIPKIQAPEIGKVTGFSPKLISWWEGLYGWLVIALSTIISFCLIFIFLPNNMIGTITSSSITSEIHKIIIGIFGILWIINAALIYQFEYLFKRHLISAYSHYPKGQ